MGIGFGIPTAHVHAWYFSDLFGWSNNKTSSLSTHAEPQNSQNIAFLEAATNVDPKKAMGGGDIIVLDDSALLPDIGPSGTLADIESSEHQGKISLYVVRKGDTLPQIAKMFGVSVNTILWANDLEKGVSLREKQTLVILPVNGVQYTVKKGDTLRGIAKKYKSDIDEIITFNDLNPDHVLSVGDTIIIPDAEETSVATSSKTAPKSSSNTPRFAAYPAYTGYYTHPLPHSRKTQGIHGYNGVDLAASAGTPVLAAADGTVVVSKFRTTGNPWFGGYGNYVVIEHANGTQTLYSHMNTVYVSVGARVDKGQSIGEVGSTGKSTGAHLHFEVRGAKNPF